MITKNFSYITIGKKSRKLIGLTILFAVIAISLSSITPIILKTVIDEISHNTSQIIMYVILLALAFFSRMCFQS